MRLRFAGTGVSEKSKIFLRKIGETEANTSSTATIKNEVLLWKTACFRGKCQAVLSLELWPCPFLAVGVPWAGNLLSEPLVVSPVLEAWDQDNICALPTTAAGAQHSRAVILMWIEG